MPTGSEMVPCLLGQPHFNTSTHRPCKWQWPWSTCLVLFLLSSLTSVLTIGDAFMKHKSSYKCSHLLSLWSCIHQVAPPIGDKYWCKQVVVGGEVIISVYIKDSGHVSLA